MIGVFLQRELRRAAELMSSAVEAGDAVTLAPLHQLYDWCDAMLTNADTHGVRVPLYLVSRLLDDVFTNLTGDFLYNAETEALRQEFLIALASDVAKLSSSSMIQDDSWQQVIERTIGHYFEVIHQLNSYLEDSLEPQEE